MLWWISPSLGRELGKRGNALIFVSSAALLSCWSRRIQLALSVHLSGSWPHSCTTTAAVPSRTQALPQKSPHTWELPLAPFLPGSCPAHCLRRSAGSGRLMQTQARRTWLFVSGFFRLVSCFQGSCLVACTTLHSSDV